MFRPLGPEFGPNIRGGGQAPRVPPLDPPLICLWQGVLFGMWKRGRGPPGGEGDKSSMQKGTLVFSEATAKSISFLLTVHFITVNQVFRQDKRNVCSGLCYNKVKQFLK